ncbi:MAG: T9SS type A sorting domain-containing protein, partial [Bacteroidota bacterium]
LTYYSNIITLKEVATGASYTILSNRINTNEVVVNSKGNYSWRLMDMNGRSLQGGRLTTGINRLSTPAINSGMYLLQIADGQNITTERIIKN